MSWQHTALIIAGLLLLATTWLGRYELIGVPAGGEGVHGVVYRLDRWTGQVAYIQMEEGGEVKIGK